MQIFIKTQNSTLTANVTGNSTIADIERQCPEIAGGYMTYAGKPLLAGVALSEYSIPNEGTLQQCMRLPGGHCQVPCGIFDDPKLVAEIKEACATIRKAMVQINELHAKGDVQSFNQMTRWVNTKEEHANKIIRQIGEYCLCQRVKPVGAPKSPFTTEKDFVDALKAHHAVMVAAMKAKQTVDVSGADALEHAVGDFSKMYLPVEGGASK